MSHILNFPRRLCALTIAIFFMCVPVAARAQAAPLTTVALVRELPDSTATATIIRTANRSLVLLRERDADAATLATAMASLYRSQVKTTVGVDRKLVINLHGQRPLESLRPNERQLAEHHLGRLRHASLGTVEGVGVGRVAMIALEARKASVH